MLHVRPGTEADVHSLTAIADDAFGAGAWPGSTKLGLPEKSNAPEGAASPGKFILVAETATAEAIAPDSASAIAAGAGAASRRPRLVAYAILQVAGDESELQSFAVHRDFRRRGIGSRLLEECFQAAADRGASAMYLEVRARNEAGRSFYLRHGFEECGMRRSYYSRPPDDAVLMRIQIPAGRALQSREIPERN
jgi:ribosomal-protein-alanine acetyltransferase